MKCSEIWYVDASQQRKCYKKTNFRFQPFLLFLTKKQPKLDKNEENWQNPNRLMKFSEIWYVDASQQKKMLQKHLFGFRPYLAFCGQKSAKIDKKCRKLAKSKSFDEIF